MANISGINSTQGPRPVQPGSTPKTTGSTTAPAQQPDTVEISSEARIRAKLAEVPDVRSELVDRVKAEIQAGTYDTTDKLNQAIDRMLEEI
jgi:negative regulator of flagellin synthesis FlgM